MTSHCDEEEQGMREREGGEREMEGGLGSESIGARDRDRLLSLIQVLASLLQNLCWTPISSMSLIQRFCWLWLRRRIRQLSKEKQGRLRKYTIDNRGTLLLVLLRARLPGACPMRPPNLSKLRPQPHLRAPCRELKLIC